MGDFSMTCMLSGLGINGGDKVKLLLLERKSFHDSPRCYINDAWELRSLPVDAEYNSYGLVEKYKKTDPAIKFLMAQFKDDLIEKGVGDNSCHDVAVNRSMSFDEMLNALREERVEVGGHGKGYVDPKIQDFNKKFKAKSYSLDQPVPGIYRVRVLDYDARKNDVDLEAVSKFFGKQWHVIKAAEEGSYSFVGSSVLAIPKPSKDAYMRLDREDRRPATIMMAMIRADVWELAMAQTFRKFVKTGEGWDDYKYVTEGIKEQKESLRKDYDAYVEALTESAKIKDLSKRLWL